jgi:hypothetical protein
MRKNLLAVLLCLAVSITATNRSNAQTSLLYFWDFNTFSSTITLPAIASLAADYSAPGYDTAKARWIFKPSLGSGPVAGYCDDVSPASGSPDFDTVNSNWASIPALGVVAAGNAFRARNPNDSMEILIYMPSTGYTNLVLSYGVESSSTTSGDSLETFSYSVDSGATWITSGTGLSEWWDTVVNFTSFGLVRININDAAANNNPKLVFRIQLSRANYDGTGGNNRFDNVSLQGVSNPSLSVNKINNIESSYKLYPNPARDLLCVNSNLAGDKSIIITNVVGQAIISETKNSANFSINTSSLISGVYYMTVCENESGSVSTLKFVKQ